MKPYLELIMDADMVNETNTCLTTGDVAYPGTALEVVDEGGRELFHVVVNHEGERQVLFFPQEQGFRMPLDFLERILVKAKETVRRTE